MTSNNAGSSIRAINPEFSEWERQRDAILELYINHDLGLRQVIARMNQRGFYATKRMYKQKLSEWGVRKNSTREDWIVVAKLLQDMRQQEKNGSYEAHIVLRRKKRRWRDLVKWLRDHRKEETEDDFLAEARAWEGPIPVYIYEYRRSVSPPAPVQVTQYVPAVPAADFSVARIAPRVSGFESSPEGAMMSLSQGERTDLTAAMQTELGDTSRTATFIRNMNSAPDTVLDSTYGTSPLGNDTRASPMVSMIHDCWNQLDHGEFIKGYQHAAVHGYLRMNESMSTCLDFACKAFRQMCHRRVPILLLVVSAMLTWLQVHVSSGIAKRIVKSLCSISQEVLGIQDPISLTLSWMELATSAGRLRGSCINTLTMRHIWEALSQGFGDLHGHTMVALYGLCFHLMLVDEAYSEAEALFVHLVETSIQVLGAGHVFTINVLATLSRARLRQGKLEAALETINKALLAAPYGLNHPHRLELVLRKAIILWKMGRKAETERLYWILTRGRIATLGAHHNKTLDAHSSLVDVLKSNGTWEASKDNVQSLLVDPGLAVAEYESWWKDTSESIRGERGQALSLGDESDD